MDMTVKPISNHPTQTAQSNGLKILMADDLEENIYLVRLFLEKESHVVIGASNGLEAVEQFQKERFDIILMDVNMPVMDGMEATRQIRALEKGKSHAIPIIAFTADDSTEDQKIFQEVGMNGIIAKPINFKALSSLIREQAAPPVVSSDINTDAKPTPVKNPRPLPEINGIAIKKAIENWGSPSVFMEQLHLFYQTHMNTPTMIQQYTASGNYADLKKICHALKGLTGNLSLIHLHPLFIKMENAVNQQNFNRIQTLLPLLKDAFDAIPDHIKQLEQFEINFIREDNEMNAKNALDDAPKIPPGIDKKRSSSHALPVDPTIIRPLLLKLYASFDQYDPDASLPFIVKLQDYIDHEQLTPITEWIDRFDFDAAKKETKKLRDLLFGNE